MKNQIYPCLWFDSQAKTAAEFYCSVFKNSSILEDTPMVVTFALDGQKMMGLNGGPTFEVNPSISFFVVCETEAETDAVWQKLLEGGSVLMPLDKYPWSEKYGWCKDKFGVNWQIAFGIMEEVGQKFTPTLMYCGAQQGKAEKAIHFYTSLFRDASVAGILKYEAGEHGLEGQVKHAQFTLNGYVLMAMDSGVPQDFTFNEGISLVIECATQEEIDHYWENFTKDGAESMCGWLKDPFGVSWQIVPAVLKELMKKPEKSEKVMQRLLQMKKLDIEQLVNA